MILVLDMEDFEASDDIGKRSATDDGLEPAAVLDVVDGI